MSTVYTNNVGSINAIATVIAVTADTQIIHTLFPVETCRLPDPSF